jgi:hypothetical protein
MVITLRAFTSGKCSHRSARNEQNTMSEIIDSLDVREYGSEYLDSIIPDSLCTRWDEVQGMTK